MRSIILGLALIAVATSTHAAQQCTQLGYTGAPFTTVTASANNNQPIASPLVGTITLAEPLPANASNYVVSPAAWDFSTENSNYTSTNGWFAFYNNTNISFAFSTDANGNIIGWSISLYWDNGPTENFYSIKTTSTNAGDAVAVQFNNTISPSGPMQIAGSSASAGTWSCISNMTATYAALPDPPPVNPLAAQVAALTAEVNSLIAERNELDAAVATLEANVNALTAQRNGYIAAYRTRTAEFEAEVVKYDEKK